MKLKKILTFLFAPSAFKFGVLLTGVAVSVAVLFYEVSIEGREANIILKFINDSHLKSIDFRMIARGERQGAQDIALLVIDEPSLETLGRWPWPRTRIAATIDELMKLGAKVLAFDAVFSEPELNPATRTLSTIKSSGLVTGKLEKIIDEELEKNNSDKILAASVAKHADHLVMGAYFDNITTKFLPHRELCSELIDAKTPEAKFLENEEKPIMVLDESSVEMPDDIKASIEASLDAIRDKEISGIDESTLSTHDKIALRNKIELAMKKFCFNWPGDEKNGDGPQIRGPANATDPMAFIASVLSNNIMRSGRWWMNIAGVAQNTKHTGYFNAFQDSDGTLRNSQLLVRYGNQILPSIALKTVMVAKNLGAIVYLQKDPVYQGTKSIREIVFTDGETGDPMYSIPTDSSGKLAINYAGPRYSYPHLGVGELFNGKETAQITFRSYGKDESKIVNKAEFIKDKIFLFGATATGIYDLRVTPFEENFPGPETHTNIMDNLINKNFLRSPANEASYMISGLALGGFALSALIANLGAVIGLLVTLMALIVVWLGDRYFLFQNGQVVTIVLPLFLIGLLYTALTFYKYLTEERNKKELKSTFAKYVSPSVVNEILKHPENINLGGKKQRMTVMFSDVRGFTTFSEKLEPTKLSELLNRYLTPMTRLVFENKGTLDKYMGDAIMSFFGAPIEYPDHAKAACKCALDMMNKLEDLRKEFAAEGLPDIDIGIGINTGDMSVGNMGSDIVRSYTVMGDSVNLGSRLEGINKEYGTHIIVSEFTYNEIKDDFTCREVDWVRVKGKKLPVRIFELIGEKSAAEKQKAKLEAFKKGFDHYHNKLWDEALSCFQETLKSDPNDYLAKVYVKRCEAFKQGPPPSDWDGVFEMKTK